MKIDVSTTLSAFDKEGAVVLDEFLKVEEVDQLLLDFKGALVENLNNNIAGSVFYLQQKFVSQTLVHSKMVLEILTGDDFFKLCQAYLTQPVIKATRYYETGPGGVSMWHHDEKNDGYSSLGMIAVLYLSDVETEEDGPFEFIPGSHLRSLNMTDDEFFVKKIEDKFNSQKVTCIGKRGTLILADSRIIHRARPHNNRTPRTSLFVQISRLDERVYRERLLVNPSFIDERIVRDRTLLDFLGFGLPSDEHIYPYTSVEHMPMNKEVIQKIWLWFISNLKREIFEFLPVSLKKFIRKCIARPVDYDAQKR